MRLGTRMLLATALLGAMALLAACAGGGDTGPGHTVSLGGVKHMDGYANALATCTGGCHGTALRGGGGPSCYSCHTSADHTIGRGGQMHRVGAAATCYACHGPANAGGLGPACATCHPHQ